jgi:tetratricopeptide (TPR) repeat protein
VSKSKDLTLRGWAIAAGSLAAAAALVFIVAQPEWLRLRSTDTSALEQLVAAAGTERFFEPRLSANFAYGPLRPELRGDRDGARSNAALLTTASAAERAASDAPSAANLHAWGVAQLLLGRTDDSIATLLRATRVSTSDANLLSDLSAAYLARAARSSATADFDAALSRADAALAIQPTSASAAFNRALALEGLGRTDDALAAWQVLLTIDSQSGWAQEARTRIQERQRAKPLA